MSDSPRHWSLTGKHWLPLLLLSALVLPSHLQAQKKSEEPAPTEEAAAADNAAPKPVRQGRGLVVPNLDIFFPEGEFDLKLNRLIDRVFFEGQLKYDFIDGDITAFLRYRYYGFRRTYQLTVFDDIEFDDIEDFDDDFERVRGILFLTQWPHNFHRRTFLTVELDGISTNKQELQIDDRKIHTFLRLAHQIGTPDDSRSNSIVGERRAQIERLFTPFRTIGPGDAGLSGALTWGFDFLGADFDYLKAEFEGLKRFELTSRVFLIGRLHGGTFLSKGLRSPEELVQLEEAGVLQDDDLNRYLIPRSELFKIGGRENLKGLDNKRRGTDELHTTWELLIPGFVNSSRRFLRADWDTLYWVLYGGYGAIGSDRSDLSDLSNYITDLGFGFQASCSVKGYTFFVSALVAQALEDGADPKFRFSFKSYH